MGRVTGGAVTQKQLDTLQKYNLRNRTPEERQMIAQRSKEARQRNKEQKMALQECMKTLLYMKPKSNKAKQILKDFGFTDAEITNKALLMVALFQKGISGDVPAIREITNMMEKLDMFKQDGKVQSNVVINLVPVGEEYQPNEADEQEILSIQNPETWMEKQNDAWDTDAEEPWDEEEEGDEETEDWADDVYDP